MALDFKHIDECIDKLLIVYAVAQRKGQMSIANYNEQVRRLTAWKKVVAEERKYEAWDAFMKSCNSEYRKYSQWITKPW